MKKVLFILSILVLSLIPCFADVTAKGEIGNASGTKSAAFDYTLTPAEADSFTIGFSTKAVIDFTTVSSAEQVKASTEMSIADGEYVGKLPDNIYIFWQIASQHDTKITLSATAMTDKSDTSPSDDIINVTLTTTAGSTSNGNKDGTVVVSPGVKSNGNTPATPTSPVLTYDADKFGNQCAGSQKITLVTDSIFGVDSVTYTGTITATIAAQA